MVRMLSILFAGWVVNRVMVENRIRRPIALLPPPGRKRRGAPAGGSRKASAMTMADQDKPGQPGNPPENDVPEAVEDDAPVVQEDWERIDAAEAEAGADEEDVFASEEVEIVPEETDLSPEENDDNPYQESDEALPDDEEERAIRHGLLDRDKGERFGD
jgi:hypothetical protein